MKTIKVKEVLNVTKGKLIIGTKEDECGNFTTDTRKINKLDTYIGIKGEKFDGNKFWKEAFKKQAQVVIVENINFENEDLEKYKNKTIILVADTIKALGQIAKYKRSLYNIPVIAITGSVGKTSTKDIVANVVAQKYKTLKTMGNFNNHIGLPLTVLQLDDHEALVVEMGMNHFGEISYLTDIAKPTLAVITNIGTSHIGNLGSRQNILKAKLEILESMETKKLIINNDNDLLHEFYQENKEKFEIKTFGINNGSDVKVSKVIQKEEGNSFVYEGEKIVVPVAGEHFVYNSLCAIAVGQMLKIEVELIKKGIQTFELTKKRMDVEVLPNGAKLINDSYNASYESMKVAIEYLAKIKKQKTIAVLGDMFELGEYTEELHKKVGYEVAKNKIDLLICIGENAKYIGNSAKQEGVKEVEYFAEQNKALEYLKGKINKDDVILLKASNGMKFYEMVDKIKEICRL